MLKLNETPVRTARNFNINNIKVDDFSFENEINDFENTTITGIDKKVTLSHMIKMYDIKYGIGTKFEEEVKNRANKIINLNIKENADIRIKNVFDKQNKNLIDNIEIRVQEGVKTNIILEYKSYDELKYYHNGIFRVLAKKDSNVNIIIINLLNTVSNNFFCIENELEDSANVNYTIVDFGGRNSITNYYSNILRR